MVIWADRKFRLGHGRAFALYVMAYTAGRGWIEYLRIDTVEADDVFGLRLNVWTSIVLFVLATLYFVVVGRRHPGREESVWREGHGPPPRVPRTSQVRPAVRSRQRWDEASATEHRPARRPSDPDHRRPGTPESPAGRARSGGPPSMKRTGLVSNVALIAGMAGGTGLGDSSAVVLAGHRRAGRRGVLDGYR